MVLGQTGEVGLSEVLLLSQLSWTGAAVKACCSKTIKFNEAGGFGLRGDTAISPVLATTSQEPVAQKNGMLVCLTSQILK